MEVLKYSTEIVFEIDFNGVTHRVHVGAMGARRIATFNLLGPMSVLILRF